MRPIQWYSHVSNVLTVASWNVRTLLDTKRRAERPTAVVARELDRYGIDIAALSETRIPGDSVIEEVGGGYTFFLKGKPEGNPRHHGVGFAIRTKLVAHLQGKHPVGINERLMTMSLPTDGDTLCLVSAYAPTLGSSDETKERFYDDLSIAIKAVPHSHKLLVMGDFNARIGRDYANWPNVIGTQGVGNENSNGTLLLSLCAQNDLVITNTIFQQHNKYKTTWMHPGLKEWHMIDFVITRQRDIKDVNHTRAMCGACTWSDHKLVKCKLGLKVKTPHLRHRIKPSRKPDVSKLKMPAVRQELAQKLDVAYLNETSADQNAKENWDSFRDTTLRVSEEVLGYPTKKHRDWFDENDTEITPLLNQLHDLHLDWIADKSSPVKRVAYHTCRNHVQCSLRRMQNNWWRERAVELQGAADAHDFKTFYNNLKAVHGPKIKANTTIKSKDGDLITEPSKVLDRWAEHFNGVLNQSSEFDMSVLDEIPQWDTNISLNALPTLDEVMVCIRKLSSGKSPGDDGIPPEVYKHGGIALAKRLLNLFVLIWQEGRVIQDFRDATIIHLYKNKGDRACCDNHRGISLLSIAGKVLARLILNRLIKHIDSIGLVPESQCGFRSQRGTADMVFALRQLQEKCKLQNQDLYLVFIDLTKAFDTVNRDGLWQILEKVGCPKLFVDIIRSFHDDMKASVREGSEKSVPFLVTSGTKQGCVLAPTLFSIFFSLMLRVAFKDSDDGIQLVSRCDKNAFGTNNQRFHAMTKISISVIHDLLFADDCALGACCLEALQRLCDCFSIAARRFGLIISIKKTESLYQPAMGNVYAPPAVTIEGTLLNSVDTFKYLGSTISRDGSLDAEITARIAKATTAYARLNKRLWTNQNVRLNTKVSVYRAVVLTSLLYGCETWTPQRRHIKRLEKFHQCSLRKIARIRWFHKVTNYEVLARCDISSIESIIIDGARLRWAGHVVRMDNTRIPKALLYGRLAEGTSKRGNHSTYLNKLRSTLKACKIDTNSFEFLSRDRVVWKRTCKAGTKVAEAARIKRLIEKRELRKARENLNLERPLHQHLSNPIPVGE